MAKKQYCSTRISFRVSLCMEPASNPIETHNLFHCVFPVSWSDPLYILTHSKCVLNDAIHRDAKFLEKNDVMDYSLLVGCASGKLLVLGIIGNNKSDQLKTTNFHLAQLLDANFHKLIVSDYIRTYTLDKRLESIVKTNLMGAKQGLPTIVSPKLYRQRFTEAMNRYFLAVPGTTTYNHKADNLILFISNLCFFADRWEGLKIES